eukprot:symbB.v1.2.008274.t1/scaffold519.1/size192877/2
MTPEHVVPKTRVPVEEFVECGSPLEKRPFRCLRSEVAFCSVNCLCDDWKCARELSLTKSIRFAAAGDTSSETEVRAEAKEALARLVLTKRQELQSIRHQAKVQQLAQLRRRLQEQKVAGRSSKAASLEDLKETDVAKQREESCRRLRQTLLQSLNNKDDEESEELSETLVVLESDAEPTRDAKKRMLEEERQLHWPVFNWLAMW